MSWIHAAGIRTVERDNCEEGDVARGGQLMECPGAKYLSPCPNLTIGHMDFRSLHYSVPFHSRLFATAYREVTCVGSGLMLNNISIVTTNTTYWRHSTFGKHSTKHVCAGYEVWSYFHDWIVSFATLLLWGNCFFNRNISRLGNDCCVLLADS